MVLLAAGVMVAYADRSSIAAALANKPFVAHFGMTDVGRGQVGSAFSPWATRSARRSAHP
jgi:ACS family D-galactonate transporter-like MFS transporter